MEVTLLKFRIRLIIILDLNAIFAEPLMKLFFFCFRFHLKIKRQEKYENFRIVRIFASVLTVFQNQSFICRCNIAVLLTQSEVSRHFEVLPTVE